MMTNRLSWNSKKRSTFRCSFGDRTVERFRYGLFGGRAYKKKTGPHKLKWSDLALCCRKLGLGLIAVKFFKTKPPEVEVLTDPVSSGKRSAKQRKARLLEEFRERSGDYNVGGSTGRKLVTVYREKALHCAYALHKNGRMSPRKLREITGFPKTAQMLQRNVYGWFRRAERGIYELTPLGESALAAYAEVVKTFPPL